MQLKVIASNYNIYHVSRAIWERNYYAFEKLDITPETESPKENSDKLNNALKTMVLDSTNKLRVKKKNAQDSNFDFLSKTVGGYKRWWRYVGRFHIATNNPKSTCNQKDSKGLWLIVFKQRWLKRNRIYPKNQVR